MRALLMSAAVLVAQAAGPDVGLHFEPNRGQAPQQVRWIARTPDSGVLIDDSGFTLKRRGAADLRVDLVGANTPAWRNGPKLRGVTNYYLPNVRGAGIPHYESVVAGDVYAGIDLKFHSSGRELEYDFVLRPGADPSQISLKLPGASVQPDGTLIADGTRINPPIAYQGAVRVPAKFQATGTRIGFDLGSYDRTKTLVIDPVVVSVGYSTLVGGSGEDKLADMAVNALGEMHVAGDTDVSDFNTPKARAARDIFVAKLNAAGTAYVWLTFFGGTETDTAAKIALDAGDNAVVGGTTLSAGLATDGVAQTAKNGTADGIVAKFSSNGQLRWATYLGGSQSEAVRGLAVQKADSSIVVGGTTGSQDFPTTAGAWRTGPATSPYEYGFVTKLTFNGARVWSTYLRGEPSSSESPYERVDVTALALDSSANVVVAGDQYGGLTATSGYPASYYNYLLKLSSDGKAPIWIRGQPSPDYYASNAGGLSLDAANRIYMPSRSPYNNTVYVISADGKATEKTIDIGGIFPSAVFASADGQQVWFGGSTSSFVPHPEPLNSPSELYPFGLYRSADAGTTWTREAGIEVPVLDVQSSPSFLYALSRNSLWRRPLTGGAWTLVVRRPITAFAVAGDQVIYLSTGTTVLRSSNAGATWSAPIPTPATDSVPVIAAMATSPDRIMITEGFRTWTSIDGGRTWTEQPGGVSQLSSDPTGAAIYICRLQNGAQTPSPAIWTTQAMRLFNFFQCEYMAPDPANPNTIFYNTADGRMGRSSDGGNTIASSAIDIPNFLGSVAVSGSLVARGRRELRVSTDGGTTWKAAQMPVKGEIARLIARESTLFAVTRPASGTYDAVLGRANTSTSKLDVVVSLTGAQRESVVAISADAAGNVYAAGSAALPAETAPAFPVTQGAIRSVEAGGDGFAIKLRAVTCAVGVSPATWTVPPAGGALTVNITATNCPWSFAEIPYWITASGPTSGTGNATIQLTAAANATLAARTASVPVGDTALSVSQASACTIAVSPGSRDVGAMQGSTQFSVTTSQPYCAWSASWTGTWLSSAGPSGTGSGTLSLTYQAADSVLSRSATIDVSGQKVTLRQSGATCSVALKQTSGSIGVAGGLHQVPLNAIISGCDVTASTTVSWIKVTTLGGYVGLDVSTNTGPARTATVTVGGQPYTLNQAGNGGCTLSLDKSTVEVPSEGDSPGIRIRLTANPGTCAWSAFSRASWAQIFPLQGAGSRDLFVYAAPNFANKVRSTTIDIAGQTLTVSQAANTDAEIRRLVRLLYYGFFGRSASASEVDFHVDSLSNISQAEMAENFLNSFEFAYAGKYIAGLYVGLLNRDAEYGGWQFNRNALFRAQTYPLVLTAAFLASDEYKARFGEPDNEQFVRLLYRYILGREASDAEVAYQVSAFPYTPRYAMAHSFLVGNEFRTRTNSRLVADLLPSTLLMRDATEAERLSWMQGIDSGTTVRSIIQQIMNSAEFAALYK